MIKGVKEIFKNDLRSIKNNPVVIFVILVIILIPSLYALLNIQATWDPYARTSNIQVAVVNGDIGYTTTEDTYNVGNTLIEELKNNENFDWQFVNKETALNGVKNGDYYAAIIIPSNFSEQLLSIKTSTPEQAKIEYISNDKLNPVAPRLTNAGADAIQTKINNEIIKTINGIIFGKLSDIGGLVSQNKAQFLKLKAFMNELNGKIDSIDSTIGEANSDLNTINQIWPKISAALPEIQTYSNYVREKYDTLYNQIDSNPQKALTTVQNMELKVNTTITGLKYVDAILTSLYKSTGDPQLKPVIAQIEDNINKANKVLDVLQKVESDIKAGKNPQGRLSQLKTLIDGMDDGVNTLVKNKSNISNKISNATSKLGLVNSKWPLFKKEIPIATVKLNSISEDDLDKLIAFTNTDQGDVKNYFESPVELEKKHIYEIDTYGSALAPFYIPISLWIGCIISVAMITMRIKNGKKYSAETVYLGRMGLFLIISAFQALFVIVGSLLLHVQITSAILFAVTTLYISLCAMIIVYSMTSAFGNAGKALAIIILVLQITATGGIFPVEILPPFFQSIHPYLPLTYAVGALREVIAGVLWNTYWFNIALLTVFPVVAFGLTLLIKEKMDKRAQWTEQKLKDSGLF
ncbi:YhgE/Pip domain-containing protein [Methanobacterium alcaliphilum]|uniref:YhgE/Pip domain-containing protein n=1 Tax=Methanobacterium alcaliphilum TaxID=392018 RepID=UPI00200A83DB|nr:YhgE/Pip domain-containing protein [Methanobacterium alcaliphilum]MCK9151784.1 YhgE/Pip domain-containing protein [Methanobacterium alcaliphilum]